MTTYSGILEISPQWVASHLDEVLILDVRTRVETDGESARIDGAMLIPVNKLRTRVSEGSETRPVMTTCRSGKRSVLANNILRQAGRKRVASIKRGAAALVLRKVCCVVERFVQGSQTSAEAEQRPIILPGN